MRPIALLALLALLLVAASSAAVASATDELRLAGVFGSNMVLQHGTPVVSTPAALVHACALTNVPGSGHWTPTDCRFCGDGLRLRLPLKPSCVEVHRHNVRLLLLPPMAHSPSSSHHSHRRQRHTPSPSQWALSHLYSRTSFWARSFCVLASPTWSTASTT